MFAKPLFLRVLPIPDIKGEGAYGQGNHNLSVADVDGDGCDEIVYGSCVINNDGTVLYSTGLGHGDAMHIANLDPDRPGYQVWEVHEEKEAWQTYGYDIFIQNFVLQVTIPIDAEADRWFSVCNFFPFAVINSRCS